MNKNLYQKLKNIEIFIAPVNSGALYLYKKYFDYLNPLERNRYERTLPEADRLNFFVSHIFLRFALSKFVNYSITPDEWEFRENDFGKPFVCLEALEGRVSDIWFNISRTDAAVAIAISKDLQVGVDIEILRRDFDPKAIGSVLTFAERQWLATQEADQKVFNSMRIWTGKEACLKLLGYGFTLDPASFEICLDEYQNSLISSDVMETHNLRLHTQSIFLNGKNYCLSLATSCPDEIDVEVVTQVLCYSDLEFFLGSDMSLGEGLLFGKAAGGEERWKNGKNCLKKA